MSKLYEGQKLVNDKWIIVIGRRTDKAEVVRLLQATRNQDASFGGMLSSRFNNKNARLRIVTYERLETEEI